MHLTIYMKAIKTLYLGPTNYKGSRIKATDQDRNHITLNWDHELNADENHKAAAKALCEKMNWQGELIMGGFPKYNVHVFATRDF
jgi:hypothetical protein